MRKEISSGRSRALRNAVLTPLVAGAGALLAGWEAGALAAAASLPLSALQIRDHFHDARRHPLAIYTELEKAASKKRHSLTL